MSTREWDYKIGAVSIGLQEDVITSFKDTENKQQTVEDVSALIDVEVHQLNKLMAECEEKIWWLRRWQRLARK